MTNKPKRHTPGWFTATVVVLVLLGAYVGGYFWLGEYDEIPRISFVRIGSSKVNVAFVPGTPDRSYRLFPHRLLSHIYIPLGRIESRIRGYDVETLPRR